MSTSISWPVIGGTTYSIPAAGELNWQALSTFLIAIGNAAQSTANTKLSIRTALTTPVTVASATDTVVITKLTSPAAVLVNLPAGVLGQAFFIVDGTGDASTNNVTIDPNGAETINGSATYVINKDRAGVLIGWNGTSWTILAEYTNIAAGTIPRSSIALGSANQVVINSGTGALSSEAQLAKSRGGTGADNSSVTFPASGTIVTEAGTEVLTGKTIDGDDNTLQDIGIASLKTVIASASKFISFDGSGVPVASKAVPAGVVVGTTDAQVVTLKDIDGGTATNTSRFTVPSGTLAAITALTRKEGTILYGTDTDKLYTDDGAQLTPVGSGSGGGFKNYVSNPNDANAGWAASGGGVTVATSTSANRPDNITQPDAIVITRVSGTTDYARIRFTLDAADYNKLLQIAWDQSYAGTAGDYLVQIYSNTASNYGGSYTQLTTPVTSIAGTTGSFNTTFSSPGSGNQYLELRIVVAAGTTPLYLNNVTVTPGTLVQGAAISNVQTFTPTVVGLTATATMKWYRDGSVMYGSCFIDATAAASTTLTVSLPGVTIDSTALAAADLKNLVGIGTCSSAGGGVGQFAATIGTGVTAHSTDYTKLFFTLNNGTDASGNVTGALLQGAQLLNPTGQMTFNFSVPIAEWAGNGTVNLGQGAQVEYAYNSSGLTTAGASDTTSFAYGPGGAAIGSIASTTTNSTTNLRVRFQYPVQVGDQVTLETDGGSGGLRWGPFTEAAAGVIGCYITQSASLYGAQYQQINTTDFDVLFGNKGRTSSNATYAGDGSTWSGVSTFRWRMKKSTASAPVGFGLATATAAGLYNAGANPGALTGALIAANNLGETPGATVRTGTNGNAYTIRSTTAITAVAGNIITATLNKGVYLVSFDSTIAQASGSFKELDWFFTIGGTQVTSTKKWDVANAQLYAIGIGMTPIFITADSITLAVNAVFSATATSTTNTHELNVIRIA